MISPAVIDDQDLAVTLERTGEHDLPIERRHDLRAGPGTDGQALRILETIGFPETLDDLARNRHRVRARFQLTTTGARRQRICSPGPFGRGHGDRSAFS